MSNIPFSDLFNNEGEFNFSLKLPDGYKDEYINRPYWVDNTLINGSRINFPVSVTGIKVTNKVFEYPVESGLGSGVEFSGRDPISFTLNIRIINDKNYLYEDNIKYILNILKESVSKVVPIYNRILEKHNIYKCYVLSWSKQDIDLDSTITIQCKEYRQNLVEFLNSYEYETEEEKIDSNLTDNILSEFSSYLESLGG